MMNRPIQFGTGQHTEYKPFGFMFGLGSGNPPVVGPPTTGEAGWAPGALYQDMINGFVYWNSGSNTSAIWVKVGGGGAASMNVVNTVIGTGPTTLPAASIVGGLITREGPAGAFNDATDTASAIIAALPAGSSVGQSWYLRIVNTTIYPETIQAGSGVTLTGQIVVQPNSLGMFLMTYTGAGAISMYGVEDAPGQDIPQTSFSSNATTGTFGAGVITGGLFTVFLSTAATPGSRATRTATQMFGDIPGCFVGMSYILRIGNNNGATHTMTITAGTGVTLIGTMTIADLTFGDFRVIFTSPTACTINRIGSGIVP